MMSFSIREFWRVSQASDYEHVVATFFGFNAHDIQKPYLLFILQFLGYEAITFSNLYNSTINFST